MAITAKEKRDLKITLKELGTYKGRHTELVTVYVPHGYDLNKIINHLSQEQGTATNIKSTATRKNVVDALEKMLQHLKLFTKTPENGLAVFSGNVAEREGQSNVKVWSIEPPVPLNIRIYRCDKEFVLDPLLDMLETKEVYGLVVMDRREGQIAMLKGKSIIPISEARSNVPGKTKAGGQSAARYMRIREDAAKDFYKKIAELMKEAYLGKDGLKGIIVGGPGPTKYELVESGYITNDVKKKIIAIKDLSYTGPFGLQELLDRSQDVLASEELAYEKKAMLEFFETLAKTPELVGYGEEEVMKQLQMGAVATLLLSEALGDKEIEKFDEEAQKVGTNVRIISTETREGVQLRELGKVGAILRYPVQV